MYCLLIHTVCDGNVTAVMSQLQRYEVICKANGLTMSLVKKEGKLAG